MYLSKKISQSASNKKKRKKSENKKEKFQWLFDTKFSPSFIADQPKDGNYDDGKLIIVTDSQILAIPLHRCNSEKINSCRYVVF